MRRYILSFLAVVSVWAVALPSLAWPEKPVTVIVPFPPGGSTDTLARALATHLQGQLGRAVLVENRPGASGTIGASQVRRSAPDGYTVMVSSLGPFVIAPSLLRSVPYDVGRDFDLLTVAVQAPNVLVVPANSPYKKLDDLIVALKAQPGKFSFASSGNGSSDHLTAALFWQQTSTQGLHVPYKGGAPAVTDLIGAQVHASFQNINAVIEHVRGGKLRALAITAQRRSPLLPDVPTLSESGVSGADVYSWQAVAAPKGLPPAVKSRLHTALMAALHDRAIQQRFVDVGFEVVANTPEQFAEFQAREATRWKAVIELGQISAD